MMLVYADTAQLAYTITTMEQGPEKKLGVRTGLPGMLTHVTIKWIIRY